MQLQCSSGALVGAPCSRGRLNVNAKTGSGGKTTGNGRRSKPKPEHKGFRETGPAYPALLRQFSDGGLILGDLVMLTATEASSERLQMMDPDGGMSHDFLWLTGVTLASWTLAALVLGDYRGKYPASENWVASMLGPVFLAVVAATQTWALSATTSIAAFSFLVSQNIIMSGSLLDDLRTEDSSPQIEIAIATLITMACWRGIAWFIRSSR